MEQHFPKSQSCSVAQALNQQTTHCCQIYRNLLINQSPATYLGSELQKFGRMTTTKHANITPTLP